MSYRKPNLWGYKLWKHMADNHNLILLESELQEIIQIVKDHHVDRPKPKHVVDFLAVYPEIPDFMLKCPECGAWFDHIDHLAPYHWETCWCEKCGMKPNIPK